MKITGFYVYKIYVTYKAHFGSSKTDISKYNFKIFNLAYQQFLDVPYKHYCDRIAKRLLKESDVVNVFISAFLENPNSWVGDICLDIARYIDLKDIREGRIKNMSYIFKSESIDMVEKGMKFNTSLGEFVFNQFMLANICVETFIIYKKLFKFNLDSNINYAYLYKLKYEKYEKLLNVDLDKYKDILKEVLLSFKD